MNEKIDIHYIFNKGLLCYHNYPDVEFIYNITSYFKRDFPTFNINDIKLYKRKFESWLYGTCTETVNLWTEKIDGKSIISYFFLFQLGDDEIYKNIKKSNLFLHTIDFPVSYIFDIIIPND